MNSTITPIRTKIEPRKAPGPLKAGLNVHGVGGVGQAAGDGKAKGATKPKTIIITPAKIRKTPSRTKTSELEAIK